MAHDPSAFIQEYFQIRSGDTVVLNADTGWAAGENNNATIGTGLEFRIRFKVRETAAGSDTTGFKLQVNRNSGGWVDVDVLGGATGPAAQAVVSSQFADGDATSTELLTSTTTYVNGEGLEDNTSASYTLTSEETELEWCLMIMGFHDGPTQNVASNTLDFRVVEADGTAFTGTYANPTITVSETAGYIGGTFAETPNRTIWADGNKNIYALVETAESDPKLLMVKSTDGGDTFREMDGANRPTNEDMESIDGVLINDRIYIAHQESGDDVYHHVFRVSTHSPNPDTWETTDEAVTTGITMNTNPQSVAIGRRSDGDLVILYIKDNGSVDHGYYKIDSGAGWGSEQTLDAEGSHYVKGITSVMGASDKLHIFYRLVEGGVSGEVYHRSLDSSDTLSDREAVDTEAGASEGTRFVMAAPPVYWDDGGSEKIMILYRDEDDQLLYSAVITNDGSPEARKQVSAATVADDLGFSDQTIAAVAIDGTNVYALWSDLSTLDLFRDVASNDGGWGTDAEELDDKTVHWVRSTAFTHSVGNGGSRVLGYIYDNGSAGGTGRIFYGESVIALGGRRIFITHA